MNSIPAICAALAVCCSTPVGAANKAKANWAKNFEEAEQTSKRTGKPMMVDFYTDW